MAKVLILGGTTEARHLAERLAQRAELRGDAVARRPHGLACSAPGADPRRRLWRRRWFGRSSCRRAGRRADRRDASRMRTSSRRTPPLRRAKPACRLWRCAGRLGALLRATAGSKSAMRVRRWSAIGQQGRNVFRRARPQRTGAVCQRAAAPLSDPQRRSRRSAAAASACNLHHRARPVQRSR